MRRLRACRIHMASFFYLLQLSIARIRRLLVVPALFRTIATRRLTCQEPLEQLWNNNDLALLGKGQGAGEPPRGWQ